MDEFFMFWIYFICIAVPLIFTLPITIKIILDQRKREKEARTKKDK